MKSQITSEAYVKGGNKEINIEKCRQVGYGISVADVQELFLKESCNGTLHGTINYVKRRLTYACCEI